MNCNTYRAGSDPLRRLRNERDTLLGEGPALSRAPKTRVLGIYPSHRPPWGRRAPNSRTELKHPSYSLRDFRLIGTRICSAWFQARFEYCRYEELEIRVTRPRWMGVPFFEHRTLPCWVLFEECRPTGDGPRLISPWHCPRWRSKSGDHRAKTFFPT